MNNKDISKHLLKPSKEMLKTEKILKQARSVLTEGETIEKSFSLKKGYQVYATDKRLLSLKGRTIRDFDYAHISSIQYTSKRYWWLIILGIVLMVVGAFASSFVDGFEQMALVASGVIIGLIFIIPGAILKSEGVELNVVGVHEPVKYKGSKDTLDSLLQIVRQKRLAGPTPEQKETRAIDFTETIRKLAELRDDGIITQEEFEEKKSKLLRNSD